MTRYGCSEFYCYYRCCYATTTIRSWSRQSVGVLVVFRFSSSRRDGSDCRCDDHDDGPSAIWIDCDS
jgi:hypothetical protein